MGEKKEYIERGALLKTCKRQIECEWNTLASPGTWANAFEDFSDLVEQTPAADVVSKGVYEQVQWERDMAMQQLEEHGIPFGAKADVVEVVRCKDCKHWTPMDDGISWNNRGRADGRCKMLENMHYSERGLTNEDHFCSYGERKEQT